MSSAAPKYSVVSGSEMMAQIGNATWRFRLIPPSASFMEAGESWVIRDAPPHRLLDVGTIRNKLSWIQHSYRRLCTEADRTQLYLPGFPHPETDPGVIECRWAIANLERFLRRIPGELLPFLQTFKCGQFEVWRTYYHCGKPFLQLLETNPMLAWMLACHRDSHGEERTPESLLSMVRAKRTVILEALAFAKPHPAVERILRRVPAKEVSFASARSLRALLRRPDNVRLFSHLECIHRSIIGIAASPVLRAMAAPALLLELSRDPNELCDMATLKALRMAAALRRVNGVVPRQFHTKEELQRYLGPEQENAWRGTRRHRPQPFPEMPVALDCVPPGLILEPVRNAFELIAESQRMHHCVQAYEDEVTSGQYAVFRVLKPERATLGLALEDQTWVFDQLYGPSNAEASQETIALVMAWLSEAQAQVPLALFSRSAFSSKSVSDYAIALLSAMCNRNRDFPIPPTTQKVARFQLPPVPIPGTGKIHPVANLKALARFVLEKKNRELLSLVPQVLRQGLYFYKFGSATASGEWLALIPVEREGRTYWHLAEGFPQVTDDMVFKWLADWYQVPDYRAYRETVCGTNRLEEDFEDDAPF